MSDFGCPIDEVGRKFVAIEKLLGKSVTKAVVPEEFGEAPTYNTTPQRTGGGGNRNFSKPKRFNNNFSEGRNK